MADSNSLFGRAAPFGGGQVPESVRARIMAAEALQRVATEPSQPYTSRGIALARGLLGGVGGYLQGKTISDEEDAQKDHLARYASATLPSLGGSFGSAPPSGSAAPAPANPGAPPPSGGAYYLDRLASTESGGNAASPGPGTSSASGLYQFTDSTWNGLRQQYPGLGLTADGKSDPAQQSRAVQAFTNDNASALGRAGFQPTPGNLYLAHFAGPGGATAALGADPSTPVDQVLGQSAVAANPFLRGKTAGDLVGWANGKMAGVDPSTVPGAPPQQSRQSAPGPSPNAPAPNAAPSGSSTLPPGITPDMIGGGAAPALRSTSDIVSAAMAKAGYPMGGDNPDAPAPNASPTGAPLLPPGITPDMISGGAGPAQDPAAGALPSAPPSPDASSYMLAPQQTNLNAPGPSAGGLGGAPAVGTLPGPDAPLPGAIPTASPPPNAIPNAPPDTPPQMLPQTDVQAMPQTGPMPPPGIQSRNAIAAQALAAGGPVPHELGGLNPGSTPAGVVSAREAGVQLRDPSRPFDVPPQDPAAPAPNAPPPGAMSLAPQSGIAQAPGQQAISGAMGGPSPQALAAGLAASSLAPPGRGVNDPTSPQSFNRQLAAQALAGGAPSGPPPAAAPGPSHQALSNGLAPGSAPSTPPAATQPAQQAPQQPGFLSGLFGGNQPQQPQQRSGPAVDANGRPISSQQQQYLDLLSDPRTTSDERAFIMQRVVPTFTVKDQPDGTTLRINNLTGEAIPIYKGQVKRFDATRDGQIYDQFNGQVGGGDGASGGGGQAFRPATPQERAQYGVQDGRPMFMGPGGKPTFGLPETQGLGETAEAKSAGEGAAARRNTMLSSADEAPDKIARLRLLGTVLDATKTVPLAEEQGNAAAIAQRLGVSNDRLAQLGIDPNSPVNNQIASKLAGELTVGSIGAKGGGFPASNFSIAERQFLEKLFPTIENQPGSNEAVKDVLIAREQRNLQMADAWSQYKQDQRQGGKPLSYEDFEDQFRQAHGQDNIFAPVMQKYQAGGYTPTAPNPGGIPGAPSTAPGGPPTASASPPGGADPLSQARAAISAGVPRAAVLQRLQQNGINPAGL